MEAETKPVIRLNALKHHAGFIKAQLLEWKEIESGTNENFLLLLGENQFDLYTGILDVPDICKEINLHLRKNNIHSKPDLHFWLGKQEYRTLSLSDSSKWVIRESISGEEFAHVHPARNQSSVRRIKAKHLKTAILLIMNGLKQADLQNLTTEEINRIRMHRLNLSPVKSLKESRNILNTIAFLL